MGIFSKIGLAPGAGRTSSGLTNEDGTPYKMQYSPLDPRERERFKAASARHQAALAAPAPPPTGQTPPPPVGRGSLLATQRNATQLQATIDAQKAKAGADKAAAAVAATNPPNAVADLSMAAGAAAQARERARRRATIGDQRVGSIAPPQRGIGYLTQPRTLVGG